MTLLLVSVDVKHPVNSHLMEDTSAYATPAVIEVLMFIDKKSIGEVILKILLYHFFSYTGLLVIENDMSLFHTQTLARRNLWAELTKILHGALRGDSTWDSRGVF